MTETISIMIDSEDLKEFEVKIGMNIKDCIKILINSMKYGEKLELDQFLSEDNIKELKKRIAKIKI